MESQFFRITLVKANWFPFERLQRKTSGGVRTTIAKHHGRYSKSDHLCQDGVE